MRNLLATIVCFSLVIATAARVRAQGNPLPIGTVTPGTVLGNCSNSGVLNHAMFANGMTCQDITVSCSPAADIHAIYGYYTPTPSKGTIVLFSSGKGTNVAYEEANVAVNQRITRPPVAQLS